MQHPREADELHSDKSIYSCTIHQSKCVVDLYHPSLTNIAVFSCLLLSRGDIICLEGDIIDIYVGNITQLQYNVYLCKEYSCMVVPRLSFNQHIIWTNIFFFKWKTTSFFRCDSISINLYGCHSLTHN